MQSEFNHQAAFSILLDETRELQREAREIKKKVFGEMESRPIKPGDFMNDQFRKAS